jgi:hypothetical protein
VHEWKNPDEPSDGENRGMVAAPPGGLLLLAKR